MARSPCFIQLPWHGFCLFRPLISALYLIDFLAPFCFKYLPVSAFPRSMFSPGEHDEYRARAKTAELMTLLSMVKCAEREERLRRAYYPRRVERQQMTQETADHEIEAMAAVAAWLRNALVREHAGLPSPRPVLKQGGSNGTTAP